jgi:hypothetical protein
MRTNGCFKLLNELRLLELVDDDAEALVVALNNEFLGIMNTSNDLVSDLSNMKADVKILETLLLRARRLVATNFLTSAWLRANSIKSTA